VSASRPATGDSSDYHGGMSSAPRNQAAPSPNAERLREALGWERLPAITPERQAEIDTKFTEADEEARRFHDRAASE
jgi:hypothetical protein